MRSGTGPFFTVALATLVFIAPHLAFADQTTPNSKIEQIHYWQGHTGTLIVQQQMTSDNGCARGDQYILPNAHPNYEHIYSLIIAAHFADRPLIFTLGGCHEGFPQIKHIFSRR